MFINKDIDKLQSDFSFRYNDRETRGIKKMLLATYSSSYRGNEISIRIMSTSLKR